MTKKRDVQLRNKIDWKTAKVTLRRIDSLVPNPLNNPERTTRDIKAVADSLAAEGVLQPAVLARDACTIMLGHRRIEGSKLLGWPEFPCVVADWDPALDWGRTDKGTIIRTYTGRDFLFAWLEDQRIIDNTSRGVRRDIERLVSWLGTPQDIKAVVFDRGQGPKVADQVDKLRGYYTGTKIAAPEARKACEWLCILEQTHQFRVWQENFKQLKYEGESAILDALVKLKEKVEFMLPLNADTHKVVSISGHKADSAIGWCAANGYPDIATTLSALEKRFAAGGKKTRRNWWDMLAGRKDGSPYVVLGVEIPVLAAAQRRKGMPVTPNALDRSAPPAPKKKPEAACSSSST